MKWIALGLLAAVLALTALLVFLSISTRQNTAPGRVNGMLAPCPSAPNCVCSEAGNDDKHSIDALTGADLDMTQIATAIRSLGGTIDTETPEYLHARFVSRIFRFVDDLEIRAAGGGTFHVRSASRAGKEDLGVNRKRVEALRAALSASKEKP